MQEGKTIAFCEYFVYIEDMKAETTKTEVVKKAMKENTTLDTARPNIYDYLKVLAIVTMIIDHVWYYFVPDLLWLRLIWRISFPIFLFLVWFSWSYKRRRDLLIVWALLRFASTATFQAAGFRRHTPTANILIGIALTRVVLYFLQKYEKFLLGNVFFEEKGAHMYKIALLVFLSVVLYFVHPFLSEIMEYGSLSILFWLRWYLARYHKSLFIYGIAVMVFHYTEMMWVFHFWWATMQLALGAFLVALYFVFFRLSKGNSSMRLITIRDAIILFISKHALGIYAIHILLFLLIFVRNNMLY